MKKTKSSIHEIKVMVINDKSTIFLKKRREKDICQNDRITFRIGQIVTYTALFWNLDFMFFEETIQNKCKIMQWKSYLLLKLNTVN